MTPLVRLTLRHLSRRRSQTALSILGIGLGVAVVLAIDLSNDSARRAFQLANDAVAGRATHSIRGGPQGIEESIYTALRVQHRLRASAPLLEGRLQSLDGQSLTLLGIDPFADSLLAENLDALADAGPAVLLTRPNAVTVTETTAAALGLGGPGPLTVTVGGSRHTLEVVNLLPVMDALQEQGLRNVVITDIATAQVLLNQPGRLSRIDIRTDDPAAVRAWLPPSLRLVRSESRTRTMTEMTRAFHINLTALSLLAIVIGAFLIYNTMVVSVLQRRELIATLRTLGTTRGEIFTAIAGEALVLGTAGAALGLVLGSWLSQGLLALVSRTINDLYFVLQVQAVTFSSASFIKAVVLGLAAALLAALAPAWEATRLAPRLTFSRAHLEDRVQQVLPIWTWLGLALWLVAAVILTLSGRSVPAGFAALFFVIAGFALVAPLLTSWLAQIAQSVMGHLLGLTGRMAARNLQASLSRTHIAVTALAVAVSATVGVSIMITSFRATVADWLNHYLRADIYIAFDGARPTAGIDPALVTALRNMPGVRSLSSGRWVRFDRDQGTLRLFVVELDRYAFDNFPLLEDDGDAVWGQFRAGAVLISEPYAYRHGLAVGSAVVLPTQTGERAFDVAGVFTDYGSDQGVVVMARQAYRQYWPDPVRDSVALYLQANTDAAAFIADLEQGLLRQTGLRARSNRTIRELTLAIFDRTFTITGVLRLLTIAVAFVGIVAALAAIQLERSREFAMLRASGMSRAGLWALMTGEGGLMGLAAGLLSLPLGGVLALVLIHVINRRSFGWTMQVSIEPEHLWTALALALGAGLLAAVFPALRMARVSPALALRYE